MFEFPPAPMTVRQSWGCAKQLYRFLFPQLFTIAILAIAWMIFPYLLLTFITTHQVHLVSGLVYEKVVFIIIYGIGILFFLAAAYHVANFAIQNESTRLDKIFILSLKNLILLIPAVFITFFVTISGYLLLIIPGFYASLALVFYYPLIILDRLDLFTALRRTFQLIRNHWWYSFAVIILPMMFFWVLVIIIDYFTIGIGYTAVNHPADVLTWLTRHLIVVILAVFYYPFYITLILTQLNNLKAILPQQQPLQDEQLATNENA